MKIAKSKVEFAATQGFSGDPRFKFRANEAHRRVTGAGPRQTPEGPAGGISTGVRGATHSPKHSRRMRFRVLQTAGV